MNLKNNLFDKQSERNSEYNSKAVQFKNLFDQKLKEVADHNCFKNRSSEFPQKIASKNSVVSKVEACKILNILIF